ncbi:HalOD1 output domain-containing protein [Halorussus salinisoli]|uniref:HalOD1 output domain-containing protein n=1 Tax=Halorussus salinisoli TaxID=2558242 RepID=UPI0010C205A8|nr:HalOD1 output domain-containing protein [Halorussus salinisoli]
MTAVHAVNGIERSQRKASVIALEALEEHVNWESRDSTLYDFVDTDALDSLVSHAGDSDVSVEFDIEGFTVTVWQTDDEIYSRVYDRQE